MTDILTLTDIRSSDRTPVDRSYKSLYFNRYNGGCGGASGGGGDNDDHCYKPKWSIHIYHWRLQSIEIRIRESYNAVSCVKGKATLGV